SQAFKIAGKIFNVIDNNTLNVLVPYNDKAQEIINELNSDITPAEAVKLLRKAQKYTVGVYSSTGRRLSENNALYNLKCGAIALREEFYNSEYGVTAEGAEMEALIM
ncbi:MAG: CRISPR-associated helicase/endonuclease Cas3, partial [Oscillospiraceae bacterium]